MTKFKILVLFTLSCLCIDSRAQQTLLSADVQCEDTCTHIHGIDLSHYQGKVFWGVIGNSTKMSYVYLKATEGGDHIDDTFESNIFLAHVNGIKVGSYHFFRPKTEVQKQVDNFVMQCRPKEQDLIPMIDIETRNGLTKEAFCDSLFKFLDIIEKVYKQKPLLYTGTNFYNANLIGKINDYPLMIAQYTEEEPVLADEKDITMWQYSGKGKIKGINTFVDKSRFMGAHELKEIKFEHW